MEKALNEELLEPTKKALRLSTNTFDDEVLTIIDSAILDLKISGLEVIDDTNPLVQLAVINYAKAHFKTDENSDKYMSIYNLISLRLILAQ